MSLQNSLDAKARKENRPRLDALDRDQLRDLAAWVNAYNPQLLASILDDLDEEWSA